MLVAFIKSRSLLASEDPGLLHDEPSSNSYVDAVVIDCYDEQFQVLAEVYFEESKKSCILQSLKNTLEYLSKIVLTPVVCLRCSRDLMVFHRRSVISF